jgi:hypothetical protein
MLLPLAPQPFTAPTDRDMLPSERRAFVYTHRNMRFRIPAVARRCGHVGRLPRTDRHR